MYYLLFKWCVVWYFLGLPPLSHSAARPQSAMQKVCDTSLICSHLLTEWSSSRTWIVPSIPTSYLKLKSGCSLQARKVKKDIFYLICCALIATHWFLNTCMDILTDREAAEKFLRTISSKGQRPEPPTKTSKHATRVRSAVMTPSRAHRMEERDVRNEYQQLERFVTQNCLLVHHVWYPHALGPTTVQRA